MMLNHSNALAAFAAAFALLALSACGQKSAPISYRIDLVGQPEKTAPGVNVVSVRLTRLPDNKPVFDAVIFETKADMGPENMAGMTAPVTVLPSTGPSVYRLQVQFGDVWNKPGNWALTLGAKVQGETQTARGSVTVKLEP
jgi:hypothetical protein